MKKYLITAGLLVWSVSLFAQAEIVEGKRKRDEDHPTAYMSYGVGLGYSNYAITKYNPDFYRNIEKSRAQGVFGSFSADITFLLRGRDVVDDRKDGLVMGIYVPLGFGAGKARGTEMDPFWLGARIGAGVMALYKINDKVTVSLKEYWALLTENTRHADLKVPDAGLYTSLGVSYGRLYLSYAHNFIAYKKSDIKPLSVVNLKYNMNKGNCIELNTEYSMGKVTYRKYASESYANPYSGYTITVGFVKIF